MNVVGFKTQKIVYITILCVFSFFGLGQTIPHKTLSFSIGAGSNSGYLCERSLQQKYSLINPSAMIEIRYMRNKKWGLSGAVDVDVFKTTGKINQYSALISPSLQGYVDLKNQNDITTKKSRFHHFYHFGIGPGITTNKSFSKRDIVFIGIHGYKLQKSYQKIYWNIGISQSVIFNQSYKFDMISSNKQSVNFLFRLNIGLGFIIYSKYYTHKNRLDSTY